MALRSRDFDPPSNMARSANMSDFYRFLDNKTVVSHASMKRTRDIPKTKMAFGTRSLSEKASARQGGLRDCHEASKPVHRTEKSAMFGGAPMPYEETSAAAAEHEDFRRSRLLHKTHSNVLYCGEEKVRYFRKAQSIRGCPVATQDTGTRVFGDDYVEHPQTVTAMTRAQARRLELRNQDARGRRTNPVTHEVRPGMQPNRPESGTTRQQRLQGQTTSPALHLDGSAKSFFDQPGQSNPISAQPDPLHKTRGLQMVDYRPFVGSNHQNLRGERQFRGESVERAWTQNMAKTASFARSIGVPVDVNEPRAPLRSHTMQSSVFAAPYAIHAEPAGSYLQLKDGTQ